MISSEAQWNNILVQQNEAKIVKSKSAVNSILNNQNVQNDGKQQSSNNAPTSETCHETSLDEEDFNDFEKKRQRRRRK